MKLPTLNIEIHFDSVIIEGVTVPCPKRVATSDWIAFWESAIADEDEDEYRKCPKCGALISA